MKTKSMCEGCHQDFYNKNTKDGCWNFESARLVTMTQVGTWQNPPYSWIPAETLSCHTAPEGRSWIKRDDPRIKHAQEIPQENA